MIIYRALCPLTGLISRAENPCIQRRLADGDVSEGVKSQLFKAGLSLTALKFCSCPSAWCLDNSSFFFSSRLQELECSCSQWNQSLVISNLQQISQAAVHHFLEAIQARTNEFNGLRKHFHIFPCIVIGKPTSMAH